MNARRVALAVALALAPYVAVAADLPVSYLVEEKPLKASPANNSLYFEIYRDSSCTSMIQSVAMELKGVPLLVRLKQLTPKNDTKLPNMVEMRLTLPDVTLADSVYLSE